MSSSKNLHSNLEGKLAVITGGSGYLCSEMASTLIRNGAKVVILSRSQKKLDSAVERISNLTEKHSRPEALSVDVTDRDAIIEAHKIISSKWGGCDILINGAGGNVPSVTTTEEFCNPDHIDDPNETTFFDFNMNDLEDNFKLNFTSALMCAQIFGKDMIKKGAGNIINLSSMATHSIITRVASYSASKSALDSLTQWLAVYFSKVGIRVNAIAPGFFIGEQNRKLLLNDDDTLTPRGNKIIRNTPMDRFGTADELSSTLLYLVSDDSKFVTGLIIPVDGGFSCFSGV